MMVVVNDEERDTEEDGGSCVERSAKPSRRPNPPRPDGNNDSSRTHIVDPLRTQLNPSTPIHNAYSRIRTLPGPEAKGPTNL